MILRMLALASISALEVTSAFGATYEPPLTGALLASSLAGQDLSLAMWGAAGGSVLRAAAIRAADAINVADFGAVGDFQYIVQQFAMTAGSNVLAAGAGRFRQSMVGSAVVVPGAGASGAALLAHIVRLQDVSDAVLDTAASTTIGSQPVAQAPVITVEVGTDDTGAINQAYAAARTRILLSGSTAQYQAHVYFPYGTYLTTGPINLTGFQSGNLVTSGPSAAIHGAGQGMVVVDALGSRSMDWSGVDIFGDAYLVPGIGLQIGRTGSVSVNSSDNNYFGQFTISGATVALLNEQSETTMFSKVHFYGAAGAGGIGVAMDGYNHLRATSSFISNGEPADTNESFGENLFDSCIFGGYDPLWIAGATRMNVVSSYLATNGPYGVVLYSEPGSASAQLHLDLHMESTAPFTDAFLITGTNPTPDFEGFHWNDVGPFPTNSAFRIDPTSAVTSVSMGDADIDLQTLPGGATKLFDAPQAWTVSGRMFVPTQAAMNLGGFAGLLFWPGGSSATAPIASAIMTKALGDNGIAATGTVGAVSITLGNGFYNTQAAAFTPSVTFSAPASGITAAAHVGTWAFAGSSLGQGGTAGSDTYQDGAAYPIYDQAGNALPGTVTVHAANGAVTSIVGFSFPSSFALAGNAIPAAPLAIGRGSASLSGMNFNPASIALDNPGSGYTSPPTVTASNAHLAGTAITYAAALQSAGSFGTVSDAGALTVQGNSTFGGSEIHRGQVSLSGPLVLPSTDGLAAASVATPASGAAPSGATVLGAGVSRIANCAPNQPLQLPAGPGTGGSSELLVVNSCTVGESVYPPAGGQIDDLGTNLAVTVAPRSVARFVSTSPLAWYGNEPVSPPPRATTVTTASDGTFSVTWNLPLVSATPVVGLAAVNGGSGAESCALTAAPTSTGASGRCVSVAGGANASVTPVSGGTVYVTASEPSQ